MAKRRFVTPVILSGGLIPDSGSSGTIIGHGSAQTGIDPYPCDYEEWLTMFAGDYDGNEDGEPDTYEDWQYWMNSNGFDPSDFED